MSTERIRALQASYAWIHMKVLAADRKSDDPHIRDLQEQELRIVQELRALGAQPSPAVSPDVVRNARAC